MLRNAARLKARARTIVLETTRPTPEAQLLVITGETSSEALRQANERSYTLLQKPIAPEVLRRAIVAATIASPVVTL